MKIIDKLIDYTTNRVLDSMEARQKRFDQAQAEAAKGFFQLRAERALYGDRLATGENS